MPLSALSGLSWGFFLACGLQIFVGASSHERLHHHVHNHEKRHQHAHSLEEHHHADFSLRDSNILQGRDTSSLADTIAVLNPRDTQTIQLFNASDFYMLSRGCATALAQPLNCSQEISSYLYTWAGLGADNITNLCTTGCAAAISSFRANVLTACANDIYTDPLINATDYVFNTGILNDIYNVQDISVKPIAFADYYFLNYKLVCMQDNSTPPKNCYLLTGNNITNGTAVNPCGACEIGSFKAQMEDSRTYDEALASQYSSLVSSCGVTMPPLITPTPVFLSNTNSIVANYTSTHSCTGSVVPLPSGSSCDGFAKANSISTDKLLMLNGLQGGCADWPGNLSTLCVEGSCKPYVLQQNDTCLGISAANNITLIQLLSWNPSIDPVCSNLNQKIGHVICLSSPMGYTAPNQTDLGVGPTPATTAAPVPTSALNQTNKYCGAWYYVNPGDYCELVCNKNGITLSDFYFLNPEINVNCTNLWANSSYCVEPVGDISTYPGYGGTTTTAFAFSTDTSLSWSNLPTTTAPSYPNATTTGYPLANGSISGCFQMFNNKYGNLECGGAAKWFGVNVFDFLRWNPSLLNGQNYTLFNCHLANQTQYCASFYNQSLVPSNVDQYAPTPTDAAVNSTAQCLDWYTVVSGDTCDSICQIFDIPFSSFYQWNPAIGPSCGSLWLSTSYCVIGPGFENASYNATTTSNATMTGTATTTTGTGPPAPTQSGIAANCAKWYVAKSGDSCSAIAATYFITLAQFYTWNPAVGSACTNLWIGEAYCVQAPASTTTSTSLTSTATVVAPPGPTQSGIPSNCIGYSLAQSGDGCSTFATRNGITLANLYAWNPVLGNTCLNFWLGEAYCIKVSS